MRGIFLILALVLLSTSVVGVPMDDYEQVTLQTEIRSFPEQIITACQAEYNEGMVFVKQEIDSRMAVFPTLIAVSTAIGASVGAFIGVLSMLVMFKKTIMNLLKTRKELTDITHAYLKKLEEVTNGRDSGKP